MFEKFSEKYITPKNIIFLIVVILFLEFITQIKDIAILFFASFVISCSLNPVVDKLSAKINRTLATTLVLGGTLILGCGFFVPLIWLAAKQIKPFIEHIPLYIETIKDFISSTPFVDPNDLAQIDIGGLISSATDFTSKFVNQSINFSLNFASGIIYLFAALIIIFYFMADKDKVNSAILSIFPSHMKEKANEIIETISSKIGGYVIAQITTMTSVGLIMTIGLLILGVDYAILLGLITAILDIIPVVGPAIALIISIITVYKSGWLVVLLVTLVFAIAQGVENNLVRPYIFGKFLDLHPLIIYFFLLVTAQFLGVIGVIFSPAIAATTCVLIEELYIKNIN
jgi:predicted PurR-regulated permease PerM